MAHAILLARAGYFLAPVTLARGRDGVKRPTYHGQWGKISTRDERQLVAWAEQHGPGVSFCVDCERSGIVAIDLDVKPDKGIDAVLGWAVDDMPCGGVIVETLTGGQHHYFRAPDVPVRNSTGAIAPGVDVRGLGGHVYAPGAHVAGEPGEYTIQGDLVPVDALPVLHPAILERIPDRARPARGQRPDGDVPVYGAKHDPAWLERMCLGYITAVREHNPRHETGFRDKIRIAGMFYGRAVAAGLLSRGRAESVLGDACRRVWGSVDDDDARWIEETLDYGEADPFTMVEPRPEPPADAVLPPVEPVAELPGILPPAGSAPTSPLAEAPVTVSAVVEPGVVADPFPGESGYDEWRAQQEEKRLREDLAEVLWRRKVKRLADEAERPHREPIAAGLVWDDELESIPPPQMAIKHLLPERAVGFLGGPSGAYKTFVAVQLAVALAYGVPPMADDRFAVRAPRKVLYVAGEGSAGVALRTRAARRRLGITQGRQLVVYPRAVNLTSEVDAAELLAVMLENGIEALVVDTFRQNTLGIQENDNSETSIVLGRLLAWRDQHGIGSLLLDHTAKTAQGLADLGGAGAKRANADYVLMVDLPNGSRDVGEQRTLRVAKFKDLRDGESWPIRLVGVEDVVDADGCPSAVAEVGTVDATADIRGTQDWRFIPIPDDVRGYDGNGRGRGEVSRVAQLAIQFGTGATGITRAEAVAYLREGDSRSADAVRKAVARGWDALHELGRLEPVSPSANAAGAHLWVRKPDDPA